jgi:hypothetical protein
MENYIIMISIIHIFLQDQVLMFIHDIFNIDKVRYTTVPELADDILAIARERSQIAEEELSS